jgi:hypothetical protein
VIVEPEGIQDVNIRYIEIDSPVWMDSGLQEKRRDVSVQDGKVGLRDVYRATDGDEVCWRAVLARFLHERLNGIEVRLPVHERFGINSQDGQMYSMLRVFGRWLDRCAVSLVSPLRVTP